MAGEIAEFFEKFGGICLTRKLDAVTVSSLPNLLPDEFGWRESKNYAGRAHASIIIFFWGEEKK